MSACSSLPFESLLSLNLVSEIFIKTSRILFTPFDSDRWFGTEIVL